MSKRGKRAPSPEEEDNSKDEEVKCFGPMLLYDLSCLFIAYSHIWRKLDPNFSKLGQIYLFLTSKTIHFALKIHPFASTNHTVVLPNFGTVPRNSVL